MPIDRQAQAVLDEMAASGMPPVETLSPAEARAIRDAAPREPGPPVAALEDRHIAVAGGDIPLRIYTPEGAGPFPILVWLHGGGWVIGNLDTADGICRHLATRAGCIVVSVGYRLAPESKFPIPVEDSYAATVWAAANASSFNGNAARIAVGGDSAGGNLATAVTLMARDRGGPRLAHQLLVYPVTQMDFTAGSFQRNSEGYLLTRSAMAWYWDHYLRDDADAANPYAAPFHAGDLSGLPPALVITAEYDPLCDDGEAYAQCLADAGVPTTCTRYRGMIHGFFGRPLAMDKAKEAIAQAAAALRTALVT